MFLQYAVYPEHSNGQPDMAMHMLCHAGLFSSIFSPKVCWWLVLVQIDHNSTNSVSSVAAGLYKSV